MVASGHLTRTKGFGVSRRRIFVSRWKQRWPALIWLLACAAAAVLYHAAPQNDSSSGIRGLVDSEAMTISPVETASIKSIHAAIGQKVKKGDLLVEMNTSLIDHGITADIVDAIRIEIGFGDTHQDVLQAVSQRLDAIAAVEADIALCRQEWEREKAELEALNAEQQLRDQLHKQGLIDELTRRELLPQITNFEKAMSEYPKRMATLDGQLVIARTYYSNIMNWLGAEKDETISAAIQRRLNEGSVLKTLETSKDQAVLYRDAYSLRAPADGTVSALFFKQGDVVTAGLPIVRISSDKPTHVTAYMNDTEARNLEIGTRVEVQPVARRLAANPTAVVEGLSQEIRQVGYEVVAGRQMPVMARTARLRIDGTHDFLGGETVLLKAPRSLSLSVILKTMGFATSS